MNNEYGERVVVSNGSWPGRRISQWLPRSRTITLHLQSIIRWYRVQWWPHVGYLCLAIGRKGAPASSPLTARTKEEILAMKRRLPSEGNGLPLPALQSSSTILAKLPVLREFLSSTEYDDKTARTPGYVTIRNRGATYEVTVYDPDSGTRLPCRGQTFDEVLLLVEKLLGAAEAPWETDPYLTEQLARKAKKKSK